MVDIGSLLTTTVQRGASDLHIVPGYYPAIRIHGELLPLTVSEIITPEVSLKMLTGIISEEQRTNLAANREIDFGFAYQKERFRANIYYAKNELCGVFRHIPTKIKTIDELALPPIFHQFSQFSSGLVIVTGPTGEGKSTTLAAIINEINMNTSKHILTLEDPIEFVYPKGKSVVSQRELHADTHSFNVALRSALREDPDVVLVGEMRDYETIQAVMTVAETGHLVFSTLHTISAPEAINRIIDVFPPNQINQIKNQLSSVLRAVVTQRLVPNINKDGRVAALEILLNIPSVSAVIREGKNFMIDNVLETEESQGMILFEKYLAKLYKKGLISKEVALSAAIRPNEIKKFI